MPIIARFYGIIIKMYFSQAEHGAPHFHAVYGEYNAVFIIETLELIEGDLPDRAVRLVRDWANPIRPTLLDMWKNQEFRQLPGLD